MGRKAIIKTFKECINPQHLIFKNVTCDSFLRSMDWKNFLKRLYPLLLILVVYLVWKARQSDDAELTLIELKGTTMGTIGYSIKYYDEDGYDYA